jgi:hypothetical protein
LALSLRQRLELDFYIPSLHVAIEHHGRQHFEPVPFFFGAISAPVEFEKQQRYDRLKLAMCRRNGTTLLVVEELGRRTKVRDTALVLARMLAAQGVRDFVNSPETWDFRAAIRRATLARARREHSRRGSAAAGTAFAAV